MVWALHAAYRAAAVAEQVLDGILRTLDVWGAAPASVTSVTTTVRPRLHRIVLFITVSFPGQRSRGDLAEVLGLSESVTVPAGSFDHGLKTKETEAIDPSALENKFYAAGVGNVLTTDFVSGETLPLVMIKTQ
jgi:hypothetical protein